VLLQDGTIVEIDAPTEFETRVDKLEDRVNDGKRQGLANRCSLSAQLQHL